MKYPPFVRRSARRREHSAALGIQPRSLTPELIAGLGLKVRKGVLVEDVDPNGPAAAAGLLPGDVLLSLGVEAIHNLRDLYRARTRSHPGSPVELAVMRGPDVQLLRITPRARAQNPAGIVRRERHRKGQPRISPGHVWAKLTPAVASTLGGLRGDTGVLVLALAGAGMAGQNALQPTDVIHAVNGKPVDSVESLRDSLAAIPDGAPLVLQIEREGMLSYIVPGAMPGDEQRLKKTASRMPARGVTPPPHLFSY